ncbi:hypothetical protein CN918_30960 [Priestia megaterium]|nr:hypothetical protein CN918_30960 [Priestia megaterium]
MSEKKRKAGRNTKIIVSDDISHMDLTEEQYRLLEDKIDPELNSDEENILTPIEEEFIRHEAEVNNVEQNTLRRIFEKYKKEHGKAM